MRDDGLDEAIRVAGGVGALARKIGISQPSVSNWARIPAERVLSVEAATGVRPDDPAARSLRRMIRLRAATSMTSMPGAPRNTRCCRCCSHARPIAHCSSVSPRLRGDASPLGLAHAALAEAASRTTSERVEREYFDLFIGLGRGELLPYGSYYLTGFLHERPLARLRDGSRQARDRTSGRSGRAGRSRRHPVRDHGAALPSRPLPGACRCRSRIVRSASRSLDRAFLRRPGAGRGCRFLSSRGSAGPAVCEHRDRCVRAAGMSGAGTQRLRRTCPIGQ